MARRRVSVPSFEPGPKRQDSLFERAVIKGEERIPTPPPSAMGTGMPAQARTRRLQSQDTEIALELARLGDDVLLLPYQPTPSINPPRPRTLAAGYDRETETLRVKFRNGKIYGYYNVPPNIWRNFRRQKSPGRYINRVLNFYPYAREDI